MSKQVAVLVMQMSGKEAAAKCYDAELALLKAKDKRMKTGDIIIKTAEYSTLKLEEAVRNQVATKTVVAGTQEIVVRALIVESGAYVVEMDYIGQEIGDDELVKQARAVLEVLATEK